jgi:ketosteroid isomerase-like protein
MSEANRNVEMLKHAYRRWAETKGASSHDWLSICDDKIAFGSLAQGPKGAHYLTAFQERNALKEYFDGLARDWEMLDFVTEHYVAQDDRVVVLGRCSWKFKKTGNVVNTPKADSWRFKDGKAVEYFEYYDTAQVHAALGLTYI